VTDRSGVESSLNAMRSGDVVINTAAFHRTDDCEERPDLAFAVNAVGAQHVAAAAGARGASVVFLSSDYVFDGSKKTPYVESDTPRPINAYGISKLAGEMLVRQTNPRHYVVRISSVFGVAGSSGKGGNFVETMLAKARRAEAVAVVDDIVMAPTFAADAAGMLIELLARGASPGTYHLANAGECSWREFADAIFTLAGERARASAVHSGETATKARRPSYSVLGSEMLAPLGLRMRPWREALEAYLVAKGHIAKSTAS
jgi:dTDP-4-dehydrorhamnose reductase